jgi:hypothetical protein
LLKSSSSPGAPVEDITVLPSFSTVVMADIREALELQHNRNIYQIRILITPWYEGVSKSFRTESIAK